MLELLVEPTYGVVSSRRLEKTKMRLAPHLQPISLGTCI